MPARRAVSAGPRHKSPHLWSARVVASISAAEAYDGAAATDGAPDNVRRGLRSGMERDVSAADGHKQARYGAGQPTPRQESPHALAWVPDTAADAPKQTWVPAETETTLPAEMGTTSPAELRPVRCCLLSQGWVIC